MEIFIEDIRRRIDINTWQVDTFTEVIIFQTNISETNKNENIHFNGHYLYCYL